MIHLFDRLVAGGGRAFTSYDLSRLTRLEDQAPRSKDTWRLLLSESDPELSPAELDERADYLSKNSDHVSRLMAEEWGPSDLASSPTLPDAVLVAADNVARYLRETVGTVSGDGWGALYGTLGTIAPPFESMFLDFRELPGPTVDYSHPVARCWGAHVESVRGDLTGVLEDTPGFEEALARGGVKNPIDQGWTIRTQIYWELEKGDPFGPVSKLLTFADNLGQPIVIDPDGLAEGGVTLGVDDGERWNLNKAEHSYVCKEMLRLNVCTLLAISFMHCKNVDLIEESPPPKLSKKFERRHGKALHRYFTLDINPMTKVLSEQGHAERDGLPSALHICRGHFKTYSESAPLFGRITGTYWWADQVRGDTTSGIVEKDYRIAIGDETDLGAEYEPEDEDIALAGSEEGRGNPDLSGRGLAAHRRTLRLLAEAVENAGHIPRRASRADGPQFDLAWKTPEAVWVAEVKSLTESNELSQMHSAIGQVVDYAHRLDCDSLPVKRLIAVECQPIGDHWVEECARNDIILAWPDGFATVVQD